MECRASKELDGGRGNKSRKVALERKSKRRTSSRCAHGSHQSMSYTHMHVAAHRVTHCDKGARVRQPSDSVSHRAQSARTRPWPRRWPLSLLRPSFPVTSLSLSHARARFSNKTRTCALALSWQRCHNVRQCHSTLTGSSGRGRAKGPRRRADTSAASELLVNKWRVRHLGPTRGINDGNVDGWMFQSGVEALLLIWISICLFFHHLDVCVCVCCVRTAVHKLLCSHLK